MHKCKIAIYAIAYMRRPSVLSITLALSLSMAVHKLCTICVETLGIETGMARNAKATLLDVALAPS